VRVLRSTGGLAKGKPSVRKEKIIQSQRRRMIFCMNSPLAQIVDRQDSLIDYSGGSAPHLIGIVLGVVQRDCGNRKKRPEFVRRKQLADQTLGVCRCVMIPSSWTASGTIPF
jgi:hypothetical protein